MDLVKQERRFIHGHGHDTLSEGVTDVVDVKANHQPANDDVTYRIAKHIAENDDPTDEKRLEVKIYLAVSRIARD